MSDKIPYTMTNESITVVYEGKPYTIQKGAPNFINLRDAIFNERWDDIPGHLNTKTSLETWAKGRFTVRNDVFYFDGTPLPKEVNARIVEMATKGEDPAPLFRFWERLQKNPSYRSVQQLYGFLHHSGIPFTTDGCFLTYKSVRWDYKDHHSGQFDNSPGKVLEMPRNQISDDPKVACHEGFHVGALGYVSHFGSNSRIVICKVDPADVVCVPYDSSSQKMRVCKYRVVGNHNGVEMPSTVFVSDYDDPTIVEAEEVKPEPKTDPVQETPADPAKDPKVEVILVLPDDMELPKDGELDGNEDDEDDVEEEEDDDENEVEDEEDDLDDDDEEDDDTEDVEEETEEPVAKEDPEEEVKEAPPADQEALWDSFDKMTLISLLEQSISDLRQYAGKRLKIVGASKIPGGKTALATKILQVRAK